MQDFKLTPTERKLFDALADGKPHKPDDLQLLMDPDGLFSRQQLYQLVSDTRKKLNPIGEDIVAQTFGRGFGYRRIRLLVVSMD